MPANRSGLFKPLSDEEFDSLADLLEDHSPFDTDGLLGVLHAVAVAPSLLPPSTWLVAVLPSGFGAIDSENSKQFVSLLLRMHNDVLDAINHHQAILPDPDDSAGCESFAAGYAMAAALDPLWIGDDDRWTFASCLAYLGGRLDLVPKQTLAKFEEVPDAKVTLRRDLGGVIAAAHDTFLKVRRDALAHSGPINNARARRVGRNEPCPCGSGKKYKRCCIELGPSPGAR